eukprot:5277823-Karenia_brevis.AAC.1
MLTEFGASDTILDNTDSANAAPLHGNKRSHISPTQPDAAILPAPFGGETKVDVKKPKLQVEDKSTAGENWPS